MKEHQIAKAILQNAQALDALTRAVEALAGRLDIQEQRYFDMEAAVSGLRSTTETLEVDNRNLAGLCDELLRRIETLER